MCNDDDPPYGKQKNWCDLEKRGIIWFSSFWVRQLFLLISLLLVFCQCYPFSIPTSGYKKRMLSFVMVLLFWAIAIGINICLWNVGNPIFKNESSSQVSIFAWIEFSNDYIGWGFSMFLELVVVLMLVIAAICFSICDCCKLQPHKL